MTNFQLGYGKLDLSDFYDQAVLFGDYVSQGRTSEVTDAINNAFFDGGNFAPKSLNSLFSTTVPDYLNLKLYPHKPRPANEIIVEKTKSTGAQLGIVQGIPLIGSCLAVIASIGHLFRTVYFYFELRDASKKYEASFIGYDHEKKEIMEKAMAYTIEQNLLIASLLSIPPLLKPIVRLAQAILYQKQ